MLSNKLSSRLHNQNYCLRLRSTKYGKAHLNKILLTNDGFLIEEFINLSDVIKSLSKQINIEKYSHR